MLVVALAGAALVAPGAGPVAGPRRSRPTRLRPADPVLAHLRRPERRRVGPDLGAGWTLPLRQLGPGRLLPRGRRRLQVRALRALPRPGQAVELLGRRRLPHGPPGLQRGAPGHDLERAGARHGPGQRPGHLRARARPPIPPVQPGHARPLRGEPDARPSTCWRASTSTRSSTCIRTCTTRSSRARALPTGPSARTACRAPTLRAAGPSGYGTRAAGIAFSHFWHNNVAGRSAGPVRPGLGRRGPCLPRAIPGSSATTPSTSRSPPSLVRFGGEHFDAQLECFYTGTAQVGTPLARRAAPECPTTTRPTASSPPLSATTPAHLVFDEPDNFASRGLPTYIGPMDLPNLVFNVHIYCGARSPVTGNPTNVDACATRRSTRWGAAADRPTMASPAQPDGPAWMVTEFGATSDPQLLAPVTTALDAARSAGSTGPGSTTATPRGAPTSRSSWPTVVCARPPTS